MTSTVGPTQLKNFLPLCKLGQGAFSTVYKVKRINDGQVYALKKIKMQKLKQKQKQNALNEIRILASIKSKYIICYKQAFYDQSLNLLCIVMQYANGGDLQKKISDHQKANTKFGEKQIWKAASQILIGLYILHQKGILHRDLKSANIFVANDMYKLGDLNVSKVNYQKDQMAKTQTGTPYYASPQVWRDQLYDSKCDIWSFGCLIYQMCCFSPPFQGSDLDQLYKSVQKGQYRSIPTTYSSDLTFLIKSCLKLNPKQRFSAKQLLTKFKTLNSKFMQSLQNNQLIFETDLLNTIRLPFDMKDLSKNLPMAEYEILLKQQHQTMYEQNQSKKQTVLLKNKSQIKQTKLIQPLPQRIKSYFNQNNNLPFKRRPQRPATSSKRKQILSCHQKQIRPSSAYCKAKINNIVQNFANKKPKQTMQTKYQLQKIITPKHAVSNQGPIKDISKRKPIEPIQVKNANESKQYRSKSSEYKKRFHDIIPLNSSGNKQKNKILSDRNLSQNAIKQLFQQVSQINPSLSQHLNLNQKLYERCKENSLKKISSLQKKVKYIRDQRKERKNCYQKNKQNISCILKPINNEESLDIKQKLKQKIKQSSQIFRLKKYEKVPIYMPIIKQRVVSGNSSILNNPPARTQKIQQHLQKRQNNLIARRYVASADSKRVRSYTQISNEQNSTNYDKRNLRRLGMIRKIPSSILPPIRSDKNEVKNNLSYQPYLRRQVLSKIDINQIKKQDLTSNTNIIDNSETIIRLKKRIKNRMMCHNNEQKSVINIIKEPYMKMNPSYY